MTVDETIASGQYTDRRGREWNHTTYLNVESWRAKPYGRPEVSPAQMRLLIERDKHECGSLGLTCCTEHPVVSVLRHPDTGGWLVFDRFGTERIGPEYHEWSDALAAARALAVGE